MERFATLHWACPPQAPLKDRAKFRPWGALVDRKNCDVSDVYGPSLLSAQEVEGCGANLKDVDLEGQRGMPQPWGAHALAGRAHGQRQSAPASPVLAWGLPSCAWGEPDIRHNDTSCPPPWGLAPTFPGLAGATTWISKPTPAPKGGWRDGTQFLTLEGWALYPCPRKKPESWGVC